jgi:trehalose 6-phosphate phosphatase
MTATGGSGLTISQALERSEATGCCGFFFDFDGVLAPIRMDPESVTPTPGVADQLASLESVAERVAIISARPVQFLLHCFCELSAVSLYGLYGLESAIGGVITTDPTAKSWVPVIGAVTDDARRQLPAGVYVEDKQLSVALHYRQHPEHEAVVQQWASAQAKSRGLTEQRGRMVTELKPPVSVDKGTILRAEVADLRSAWYFGDDISDAKGFEALRHRQRHDPEFFGVCVAVRNPETGQALAEEADYTVADPADMPDLLRTAVAIFADH